VQGDLGLFLEIIVLLKIFEANLHFYNSETMIGAVALQMSEMPLGHLSYSPDAKHLALIYCYSSF
jgi:hypothetical protein